MTQEQKAKAYDEALKRAKFYHGNCPSEPERRKLEKMFPMLRESKDDRIRKFLIQHISEWIGCIEHDLKNSSKDIESEKELAMFKAGLAYLEKQKKCVADNSKTSTDENERIINQLITLVNSAGEVLLIPTNKEELVAWLNKCKESLHIPETCKENADSFTEDERIRQWLYNLVDEGAYLCERPCATESILAYLEKQKQAQTADNTVA